MRAMSLSARENRVRKLFVWLVLLLLISGTGAAPAQTQAARLTLKTISREAAQGLVQSIDLSLPGGGYPGCMSVLDEPDLKYMPGDLELMDIAMITTCGWKAGETVKITIRDPRGDFRTVEAKATPAKHAKDVYEVNFFYQPPITAPEGIYRFTFEGSGITGLGTVKAKVTFKRPTQARLFALSDDAVKPAFGAQGGKHSLMLFGFLPEEPVRLFAYKVEGARITFFGWQDFTTDRLGQLAVNVDLSPEIDNQAEMAYFAYARETHFVSQERFNAEARSISDRFPMDLYCPGAQTPRITSREEVRAVSGEKLKIVQVPGFGSRVTVEAPGGATLYAFGQPKCIDHAFWWQVWLRDPVRYGWAAESFQGKYLVEPAAAEGAKEK